MEIQNKISFKYICFRKLQVLFFGNMNKMNHRHVFIEALKKFVPSYEMLVKFVNRYYGNQMIPDKLLIEEIIFNILSNCQSTIKQHLSNNLKLNKQISTLKKICTPKHSTSAILLERPVVFGLEWNYISNFQTKLKNALTLQTIHEDKIQEMQRNRLYQIGQKQDGITLKISIANRAKQNTQRKNKIKPYQIYTMFLQVHKILQKHADDYANSQNTKSMQSKLHEIPAFLELFNNLYKIKNCLQELAYFGTDGVPKMNQFQKKQLSRPTSTNVSRSQSKYKFDSNLAFSCFRNSKKNSQRCMTAKVNKEQSIKLREQLKMHVKSPTVDDIPDKNLTNSSNNFPKRLSIRRKTLKRNTIILSAQQLPSNFLSSLSEISQNFNGYARGLQISLEQKKKLKQKYGEKIKGSKQRKRSGSECVKSECADYNQSLESSDRGSHQRTVVQSLKLVRQSLPFNLYSSKNNIDHSQRNSLYKSLKISSRPLSYVETEVIKRRSQRKSSFSKMRDQNNEYGNRESNKVSGFKRQTEKKKTIIQTKQEFPMRKTNSKKNTFQTNKKQKTVRRNAIAIAKNKEGLKNKLLEDDDYKYERKKQKEHLKLLYKYSNQKDQEKNQDKEDKKNMRIKKAKKKDLTILFLNDSENCQQISSYGSQTKIPKRFIDSIPESRPYFVLQNLRESLLEQQSQSYRSIPSFFMRQQLQQKMNKMNQTRQRKDKEEKKLKQIQAKFFDIPHDQTFNQLQRIKINERNQYFEIDQMWIECNRQQSEKYLTQKPLQIENQELIEI